MRTLLGILLITLALLAVVGFLFLGRGRESALPRRPAPEPVESPELPEREPSLSTAQPSESERPLEQRVSAKLPAETGQDGELFPGTAELVFVGLDGSVVSGLGFFVYVESPGQELLQEGEADARGRALLTGLPEETDLVVRTRRKPPWATVTWALRLNPGKGARVTIPVGPGGALVGQVVDADGSGLAGYEVALDNQYPGTHFSKDFNNFDGPKHEPQEVVVTTDEQGRWRVDHVANLGWTYAPVDGVVKPEKPGRASVQVRSPDYRDWRPQWVHAAVAEGDVVDTGQQVFEFLEVTGQVVDGAGRPLDGVLMSAHHQRRPMLGRALVMPPAAADDPFWTQRAGKLEHDAFTDSDGRFALVVPAAERKHLQLFAWAPDARSKIFSIGSDEPCTDLVLEFLTGETFELRFVDREGRQILARAPAEDHSDPRAFWGRPQTCTLHLGLEGQPVQAVHLAEGEDGVYRGQCPVAPRDVRLLDILLPGYRPVFEEHPGGLSALQREVLMVPLEAIRLDLELPDLTATGSSANWLVAASRSKRTENFRVFREDATCGTARLKGAYEGELDLDTLDDEPRYLVLGARTKAGDLIEPIVRGPFRPGPERHRIHVGEEDLVFLSESARDSIHVRYDIRLRVVGEDGKPVEKYALDFRSQGSDETAGGRGGGDKLDCELRCFRPLQSLRGDLAVSARGFRTSRIEGVVLDPEARVDLGSITLLPARSFEARVLRAGVPLGGFRLSIHSPARGYLDWANSSQPETDEHGRFRLTEPPETFLVVAVGAAEEGHSDDLYARVEGWTAGEELELELRPLQPVRVTFRLQGNAERYVYGSAWARLLEEGGGDVPFAWPSEVQSQDPLLRSIPMELPPGRYEFHGGNGEVSYGPLTVDVPEGAEVLNVHLERAP